MGILFADIRLSCPPFTSADVITIISALTFTPGVLDRTTRPVSRVAAITMGSVPGTQGMEVAETSAVVAVSMGVAVSMAEAVVSGAGSTTEGMAVENRSDSDEW